MTDLLAGLNPAQQQAVQSTEGPLLVLAGPGSGKTRVLTHRIAYLIQKGVDPWQILAVTFTNKAAREMRERLSHLVGEEARPVMMGTFHSICARVLRPHAELVGFDRNFVIYDSDDQRKLVEQAIRELNLNEKSYRPGSVHSVISSAKNEGKTPQSFRPQNYFEEVSARVYELYQEKLHASNALDFDDLLLLTERLFRESPRVLESYQRRWRYLHVDEFQDTNLVQYELVRMLGAAHGNLFVVGDVDQSIYAWRGADYRNVMKFEETFPQVQTIALEQNYRSTQTILDAATALIRRNRQRKDKGLWSELGAGDKITLFEAYDEREEAQFVVREIERLKRRDGYRNRDFAVIYRTNAQSRALEEQFVRSSVKYVIIGGTRFYERREVKDILAYLRLLHNPSDSAALDRIINVPARGIGDKSVSDLRAWAGQLGLSAFAALRYLAAEEKSPLLPNVPAPFASRARALLTAFYRLMDGLAKRLDELNLPMLIGEITNRTEYEEYLLGGSKSEEEARERWQNVIELQNVALPYEHLSAREALPLFLENVALVSDADSLPDEEFDSVTLMTLHTAKGLEYPVVFMPGVEENILPHSRSQESPEQLEEERRLAYVGITRAKHRLYLIHTFQRSSWGRTEVAAPSRFLLELPRSALEISGERSMRPAGAVRASAEPAAPRPAERRTATPSAPMWQRRIASKAAPGAPATGATTFKAGDKVRHSTFGDGLVVSSVAKDGDEEVSVAFDNKEVGIKKLLASFARLDKL